MGRAYSGDLRERVIGAVELGLSRRAAADRFGIGVSTAVTWLRRWRESGEREARKQGARPGSKLDLYEAFLLSLIGGEVDVTLEEMRALLWTEKGVASGIGTLWRFFDARGITVKKRRAMRRSSPAPT